MLNFRETIINSKICIITLTLSLPHESQKISTKNYVMCNWNNKQIQNLKPYHNFISFLFRNCPRHATLVMCNADTFINFIDTMANLILSISLWIMLSIFNFPSNCHSSRYFGMVDYRSLLFCFKSSLWSILHYK